MSTFAERNIHVDSAIVDAALWPALQRSSIATEHAGLILLDSSRMTLIHGSVSSRSVTHLRSILLPDSGFDTGVLRQAVSIATQALPGNCSWNILMLGDESALRALPGVIEDTGGTFVITPRNEATDLILDAAIRVTEVSDIRRGSLSFSGRWKPLRQGATKCALSCIAVLLLLIIRALWENARYSTAIAQVQPMQAQIYRRAIGDPVPLGAALRLRSELIKLEALTDRSTNQNSLPQSSGLAAFELLHEMMLKIPDELKLNVSEILIDEQAVRVVGQTSSHSAAGELVRQLNLIPDLTVNPPRTKLRQDRTVDFHIYGIRKNQEQR